MAHDREPRQDRTRESNDVTTLGLGALAWLDRFAAASEARGPAPAEGAILSAALGLRSLRRSLRRWALQAAEVAPPAPALEEAPPEGLMR